MAKLGWTQKLAQEKARKRSHMGLAIKLSDDSWGAVTPRPVDIDHTERTMTFRREVETRSGVWSGQSAADRGMVHEKWLPEAVDRVRQLDV